MKKMFKYLPIVLGFVMFATSCSDDEGDTAPTVVTPSLSILVNGSQDQSSYEVTQGDQIIIALTGQKVDRDLDLIRVTQNGANAVTTGVGFTFTSTSESYDLENNIDATIRNADDETLLIRDTLTNITGTVGTTTYTFTLTDKGGLVTTQSFDIVVSSADVQFTTTEIGSIWHIAGMLTGSYSLENDASVAASMANMMADISNTDAAGDAFTGSFRVGGDRLTTDFVVAPSFDFDNATATSAQAAYDAGTAVRSMTNPSVGDIYIFDVNGTITAVHVDSVDPTDTAGGTGNPGVMTFTYKK